MSASLHIGDGFARIGGVTVPAKASARGLELEGGAVLCPVSFGQRSRLVAWSGDGLAGALLAEMLDGAEDGLEPRALQALALHLAGADSGAPGFAASAALVARLIGWPLADINAAEALEIDRLAASLAPSLEADGGDGWTTVLFTGAGNAAEEDEPLEVLCARLATDLQRRAADSISPAVAAVLNAVRPAAPLPVAARTAQTPETSVERDPLPDPWRAFDPPPDPWRAGDPPPDPWRVGDPSPDPWRDADAPASPRPEFGAVPTPAPPSTAFAQPLSQRGPDAAVWTEPAVDDNPALTYQAEPEPVAETRTGSDISASPKRASAALSTPAPVMESARANSPAVSLMALSPMADRLLGSPAAFAAPGEQAQAQAGAITAPAPASTRTDLFWQAVAAPDTALPKTFPGPGQSEAFAGQPMTQATPEPALDLDGIADALHAIADLRGVAR